jgi:hypothetical protein
LEPIPIAALVSWGKWVTDAEHMASADYHYKQAQILAQLADKTRDGDTAKALLCLAAEHIRIAEQPVPDSRLASSIE